MSENFFEDSTRLLLANQRKGHFEEHRHREKIHIILSEICILNKRNGISEKNIDDLESC